MKKIIVVAALLVISVQFCNAQGVSESVRLTAEQVPVLIMQSYEREIGTIPEGGVWTVRVKRSTIKDQATPTPVGYIYTNRKNKEKIEVKFSPEGEVTQAKGVTLVNGVSKSKEEDTNRN